MARQYHHIGIPTSVQRPNEGYMADVKLFVTDPSQSEQNIEWCRFEEGSPLSPMIQNEAHIAYLVDDVEAAMQGKQVVQAPWDANPTTRVGFVVEDGQLVELLSIADA
ncbi:MAG: hypothetical protein WCF36_11220 [Candidatus Nanopelagicales bacterium]